MARRSRVTPPEVRRYARALTAAARSVEGVVVSACYLHGSAALGGFARGRSDVDLVLVLEQPLEPAAARELGRALLGVPSCPGAGLEASAVTRAAAASAAPPFSFVVHVASSPDGERVVVGGGTDGDPDLALHYAVVRQSGVAVEGPPPAELVGPVPRELVLAALRDELGWGIEHGTMAYAVLNAARALRYGYEGVLCSKLDGGKWALALGEPVAVLRPALDQQETGSDALLSPAQRAWVEGVVRRL